MDKHKVYIAIDLKSFYASVECVARGLNPLTAKLVVADPNRTDKTICLAVSPALKSLGVGGRDRLFKFYRKSQKTLLLLLHQGCINMSRLVPLSLLSMQNTLLPRTSTSTLSMKPFLT